MTREVPGHRPKARGPNPVGSGLAAAGSCVVDRVAWLPSMQGVTKPLVAGTAG